MKRIKHLQGIGHLYNGDQVVATVRYSIDLFEQQIDTTTFAGKSSTPGLRSATVTIDVVEGEKYLDVGETFTLRLADQQQCTVAVSNSSPPSLHYTLMALNLGDLAEM